MSEATFKHAVDAAFFEAWADVVGGIDATYTSPAASSPQCRCWWIKAFSNLVMT